MAQYLFLDTEIHELIDLTQRQLVDEIVNLPDSAILSRSNEEWLTQLIDKYTIHVPTLDPTKAEYTHVDGTVPEYPVPNPNFDTQPGVPGRIYTLHVPYSGPENLFYYKPRIYHMSAVRAGTSNLEITIPAGGAWLTTTAIEELFDSAIEKIESNLQNLRNDIAPFNEGLEMLIRSRLELRRKSAEATKATTDALKYPLRKREGAPQTYKLPERPKLSLVMEQSPTVFENAEEEHIRVHYLVQLNGQYQGAATGETFNHTGKTDILIRHHDKNIFVAECKFWAGYKELIRATSQLLDYTTWRDTKTALLVFSRRMNFTSVISEAQRAMRDHPRYKSGPDTEDESRFRYIFNHPNDDQREIIITLMLFDMPKPAK
jgi:hypothetical protein